MFHLRTIPFEIILMISGFKDEKKREAMIPMGRLRGVVEFLHFTSAGRLDSPGTLHHVMIRGIE